MVPSASELQQETYPLLSEHALCQWMVITGHLLGNRSSVDHAYYRYFKLLKRKYHQARLQPETLQTYQEVMGSSQELEKRGSLL